MKLGPRLRQLGLSQKRFAAELGVSEATVSAWVSGRSMPDMRKIPLIESATAGAVTLADFLDGNPPAGPSGLAEAQTPLAAEARQLGLDADRIAEQAVRAAIGAEKARRWAEENRAAIEAWNRYFEDNDTPLAEYRMF
jgi:antitoxin CcdA